MIALGAQAFDGGDLLAGDIAQRGLARAHRLAVDMNGACAAKTRAAAEFRPCHLKLFADNPEQRRIIRRVDGHIPPVNAYRRHFLRFPAGARHRLRR
jgi:hypothetical protein